MTESWDRWIVFTPEGEPRTVAPTEQQAKENFSGHFWKYDADLGFTVRHVRIEEIRA